MKCWNPTTKNTTREVSLWRMMKGPHAFLSEAFVLIMEIDISVESIFHLLFFHLPCPSFNTSDVAHTRSFEEEHDRPSKRITLDQSDACTEEHVTSLKSPCQSCIYTFNEHII